MWAALGQAAGGSNSTESGGPFRVGEFTFGNYTNVASPNNAGEGSSSGVDPMMLIAAGLVLAFLLRGK